MARERVLVLEPNHAAAVRGSPTRRYWPLVLAMVLLLTRSRAGVSRLLQNAALLAFSRAVSVAPGVAASPLKSQAETWLKWSIGMAPSGQEAAWEHLGLALASSGLENEAVQAWQSAPSAQDVASSLLKRGDLARQGGLGQDALRWYRLAADTDPGLGDVQYAMGLAYETSGDWEAALAAYESAGSAARLVRVGRSSPRYRQGLIYQWKMDPRQLGMALTSYEMALATDDFADDLEAANCHYQRGEILRWTGGSPDAYIAEYRWALELNPDHAAAQLYLGVAIYTRDGDARQAEADVRKALAMNPESEWAWYHLGEIYRQEGRITEARAAYRQALAISPTFENATQRLEDLRDDK